jgi:seryl-tRNA synthetase
VETYQQPDGSILLPPALVPYFGRAEIAVPA